MTLTEEETRKLLLAGTVHFPPVFPELGTIEIISCGLKLPRGTELPILTVKDAKATRTILLSDVVAIFLPLDSKNPDFAAGEWLYAPEIKDASVAKAYLTTCGDVVRAAANPGTGGLVYVAENTRVLTLVDLNAFAGPYSFSGPAAESYTVLDCCP